MSWIMLDVETELTSCLKAKAGQTGEETTPSNTIRSACTATPQEGWAVHSQRRMSEAQVCSVGAAGVAPGSLPSCHVAFTHGTWDMCLLEFFMTPTPDLHVGTLHQVDLMNTQVARTPT